jgi:hypothetical protein
MQTRTLTNWKIKSDTLGRIYLVGNLDSREWETSTVLSITSDQNRYLAFTENTCYQLFF